MTTITMIFKRPEGQGSRSMPAPLTSPVPSVGISSFYSRAVPEFFGGAGVTSVAWDKPR